MPRLQGRRYGNRGILRPTGGLAGGLGAYVDEVVARGGEWLLVVAATVLINVVPIFAPPTWAVLAYFHLAYGLPVWALAAVGAVSAATGRGLLALGIRAGGEGMVPARWRANVRGLTDTIRVRKTRSLPTLALFLLSPVPSGHLFVAAGIGRAP